MSDSQPTLHTSEWLHLGGNGKNGLTDRLASKSRPYPTSKRPKVMSDRESYSIFCRINELIPSHSPIIRIPQGFLFPLTWLNIQGAETNIL